MSTPYQYHPAHYFTENQVNDFRDMIQTSLKDRKAALERAEKLPPAPKSPRKCKNCDGPLNALAECSAHSPR